MKKIIMLLITILSLYSLTACSSLIYESPAFSVNESTAPTVNDKNKSEEPVTKPTEPVSTEPYNVPSNPTLDERVIYNQNDIIITVMGIDYESWFGPQISLLIENNSAQNITVQSRNSSVNGYMIDFQMSSDISVGKKAYDTITIMDSSLEIAGIETIANLEFSFHIFDSSTWDTIADSAQISLSTSAATTYVQVYDDSGVVLYDQGGIRIISKGLSLDSNFFGPELVLYIENNSDKYITVQARDTSINGFMIDSVISDEVLPGKKVIAGMAFSSSRLEESRISAIETIETVFHIFDTDTWNTIIDTNPITITIEK